MEEEGDVWDVAERRRRRRRLRGEDVGHPFVAHVLNPDVDAKLPYFAKANGLRCRTCGGTMYGGFHLWAVLVYLATFPLTFCLSLLFLRLVRATQRSVCGSCGLDGDLPRPPEALVNLASAPGLGDTDIALLTAGATANRPTNPTQSSTATDT